MLSVVMNLLSLALAIGILGATLNMNNDKPR